MASADDIAAQIRASLTISDPDLDTSVGTTTRKIIDAVSESIGEAYVDNHMMTYQYDINSKIGSDLDTFTQLFGISRLAAKRATGTVVFTRPTGDTTSPVFIPINTQVQTSAQTPVVFITVTSATIQIGQRSVLVPVQAALGGPQGNVAAGSITSIVSPLVGVTSVTNIEAPTGGEDQETDDALRDRWRKTVFRSLAGTGQMYLGIALDDPDCYAANVIGASSTYTEQLQISSGAATSDIDPASVKFIYPRSAVVTATGAPTATTQADYNTATDTTISVDTTVGFTTTGDLLINGFAASYTGKTSGSFTGVTSTASTIISAGATVTQATFNDDVLLRDYDYTFDTSTTPPSIHSTGSSSRLVDGQIYTLSFEYVSNASRNMPTSSITNRVDVWCAGTRATDARQSLVWLSSKVFNDGTGSNTGSPYTASLYVRPDGSAPKIGNIFIPLAFGPIITVPAVIAVGATNYTIATSVNSSTNQLVGDFQIVHRNDCFGYTSKSLFGIEWNSTHVPTTGTAFTVSDGYTYNAVPANVQSLIDSWRLIGTDAKVHQAKQMHLRFNLALMLTPGSAASKTYADIGTNLSAFLETISFGGVLQVADVLRVIANTPGVDNVRFLHGSDAVGYSSSDPDASAVAIQQIVQGQVAHTYCDTTTGRPIDIVFSDDTIPVFDSISGGGSVGVPSLRAQNTFGQA
jgi:hypothetical protein